MHGFKTIFIFVALAAPFTWAKNVTDISGSSSVATPTIDAGSHLDNDNSILLDGDTELATLKKHHINCHNAYQPLPTTTQGCDPSRSKGFMSSHDCVTYENGAAYYCVMDTFAVCFNGKDEVKKLDAKNGQCFN